MKHLIVQTAFLGDVILATALIEEIRRVEPDSRIDFLVSRGNEIALKNNPHLTKVWVWDKRSYKYKNLLVLIRSIRAENYDSVLNIQRHASTGLLTAFSKARKRIGYAANPLSFLFDVKVAYRKDAHETERVVELYTARPSQSPKPRMHPMQKDFDAAVAITQGQPYITVSPATKWFTKQLPPQKWAEFIREVPPDVKVYLLGSAVDSELCKDIVSLSGNSNAESLAGVSSFYTDLALMKNALLNYASDSAPTHFASALNAPIATVFCSTSEQYGFGPVSDKSYIVESSKNLPCRPCGSHGKKNCPLGHFACATTIDKSQLLELVGSVRSDRPGS